MKNLITGCKCGLVAFLMFFGQLSYAQDDEEKVYHFNGSVSVTNNGFSFIPSFSLGKPATILDVSLGGKRFSFDPQFRFDLEGLKPWSVIFIWRYKLINQDKFSVKLGTHLPAIAFSQQTYVDNGIDKERIVAQRFLTPELTASYNISKQLSVGTYYVYGIGLEKNDQSDHTHFLSLRLSAEFDLFENIAVNWHPQTYYLNIDGTDGYFAAHTLSVSHKVVPLSVSTTMNKAISSDLGTKDFDWNISLTYTFRNEFTRK